MHFMNWIHKMYLRYSSTLYELECMANKDRLVDKGVDQATDQEEYAWPLPGLQRDLNLVCTCSTLCVQLCSPTGFSFGMHMRV